MLRSAALKVQMVRTAKQLKENLNPASEKRLSAGKE